MSIDMEGMVKAVNRATPPSNLPEKMSAMVSTTNSKAYNLK